MAKTVYIARSHRWLHDKLHERAAIPADLTLVDRRDDGDVIVFLRPPWHEDEPAPDALRTFRPGDLRRLYVFSQDDVSMPWAPGVYASVRRRSGPTARALRGGFYVPHHLREAGALAEHLAAARSLEPDLLWSFVGTAANASVRRRLFTLHDDRAWVEDTQHFSDVLRWKWGSSHRDEAQVAFARYAESIGRALFVLCPRGRGWSSARLFEAMEVGRCPVILSDGWLPPPFVDWDSCSIRVPESQAARIPELVREREGDAADLGRNARAVWERLFSPETQLETLVRACLDIDAEIGVGTRLLVPIARAVDRETLRVRAGRMRRRLHIPLPAANARGSG